MSLDASVMSPDLIAPSLSSFYHLSSSLSLPPSDLFFYFLFLFFSQSWLQGPSVYVYDCSGAGVVIDAFLTFVEQRRQERVGGGGSGDPSNSSPQDSSTWGGAGSNSGSGLGGGWLGNGDDSIQLAACGAEESLPTLPSLPADLFTSCLTTPIETSLRWAYVTASFCDPYSAC